MSDHAFKVTLVVPELLVAQQGTGPFIAARNVDIAPTCSTYSGSNSLAPLSPSRRSDPEIQNWRHRVPRNHPHDCRNTHRNVR
jgi:hypothetical protein